MKPKEIFEEKPVNNPDDLAAEFFRWIEFYGQDVKGEPGNHHYEEFLKISKKRLSIMITDLIEKEKNK